MKKQMILIFGIMLANTNGPLGAMNSEQNQLNKELLQAATIGNLQKVNTALKEGAHVNAQDPYGRTPLMRAAKYGNFKIVRLLIEKGADVNHSSPKHGITALIDAAGKNQFEIAQLLIENGAEINYQNKYGWTALMSAASNNDLEIVRLLVAKGADVYLQNRDGDTALRRASIFRSFSICKILVEAMLKLSKKQKDSIYTLIASLEKSPSLKTNKDSRRLIAQHLIDAYKKENLIQTRAEIEKIFYIELKNQLLGLLEKTVKENHYEHE